MTIHPFRKENAFETAGKIAYIVNKIKQKDYTALERFDSKTMKISDFIIKETAFNFLNKKVKNAHHALFYWNQTIRL